MQEASRLPGEDDSADSAAADRAARVFVGADETVQTLRALDWSRTGFGPLETWPAELTSAVRLMLASPLPLMVWWGPQFLQIHNDAFRQLVGAKHPAALAEPAADCWAEVWPQLLPLARAALTRHRSDHVQDELLLLDRHGYLEETYWTFSFSPIRDAGGEVGGVFVAATEESGRVVGERRLATVRELGALPVAEAGGVAEVCQAAVNVLAGNRGSVPFGVIYRRAPGTDYLTCEGSFGVLRHNPIWPADRVDIDPATPLGRAAITGNWELIDDLGEGADQPAFERGPLGPDLPHAAVILPLRPDARGEIGAVLVLGANPYRAVDERYLTFCALVARQLTVALTDAIAYEDQRARADALTELDAHKMRFFQNVSHEFRTPLTLLLGPLHAVLADSAMDLGPHRTDLDAAYRAGLRLHKLVDTLLEYARTEANMLNPRLEPTDLAALTADLASMFRSTVESAGLDYEVQVDGVDTTVEVDPEMWSRIVLNLVSNAIKFTRHGKITVALAEHDTQLTLTVADTGVGIPVDQLPRVFERFGRGHGVPGRSRAGTGIGLSLVADLVDAHRGELTVSSSAGEGSTFKVTIPKVPASRPQEAHPTQDVAEHASSYVAEADAWVDTSGPPEGAAEGAVDVRTALVVEDDADLRSYLAKLLDRDGWSVRTAGDVEHGLRLLPGADIVVLDVMLPGRSGLELLRGLRDDPATSRTPVVLLTARGGGRWLADGLRDGADDYIVKPFEPDELLARVARHHELSRLREYALSQAEERVANLQVALVSNRQIGAAVGVLMARHRVTSAHAFDMLRQASQHHHRKLRDIADEVVMTGELPGDGLQQEGGADG